MGGWKTRRGDVISESPCKSGKGTIVVYEVEEESDYPLLKEHLLNAL